MEPGTQVPIHRHPTKDETFVLLRGRVRVTIHNDDGSVKDCVVLCPEEGVYGVNIPKGVWHTLESLESGSVFFECKVGPFVGHEVDGILDLSQICRTLGVMFQFVCPKRDPHFKELSKLHVLFHTMNNTNHIFIN